MKNLIIGLIITGLTTTGFAQDKSNEFEVALKEVEETPTDYFSRDDSNEFIVTLEEVVIEGVNYKYLNAIGYKDAAEPVKLLSKKAASFDLKNSNIYDHEDNEKDYYVQFKTPEGKILAMYDNEGEIIRTSEKFKDISLPLAVLNGIVDRYPGWMISSDIYRVTYVKDRELNKIYMLFIEKTNIGKRVVKMDENGRIINYKKRYL